MLYKSIKYRKEKRKPYRGSKVFDKSCRNHGGCPYCEANRTAKEKEKDRIAKEELKKMNIF